MRAGEPSRRISATVVRERCPVRRLPVAVASRSPPPDGSGLHGAGPPPPPELPALSTFSPAPGKRAVGGRDYHARMGLSLLVGPAHAGKVALLLERYLEALGRDPWLIVPSRLDVERVERDLLRRRPVLLSGTIGTFADLFRAIAPGDPDRRPVASDAQRALAVRPAIAVPA